MIPTFLYIKQHSKTGLLYFGKTTKDPISYLGSGKYWLNHLRKHGKEHVNTIWYCLFVDQIDIIECATLISTTHDIVRSPLWANLSVENGTDGGPRTNSHLKIYNLIPKTPEQRAAISKRQKGKASKLYPIEIDNVTYPSITAAGLHFGLTDAAIHYWIKTGKATRIPITFKSIRYCCAQCRSEISIKSKHNC